jgi:hypothetical protein
MLGSYVSAAYVSQPAETGRRFFEGLLDWAGVRRPVTGSGDPVEVRLLESGREHLVFVFNHAPTPATAAVTVRVPLDGRIVEDLASGGAVAVTGTADGFEWRGTIGPRDVKVLRIRPVPRSAFERRASPSSVERLHLQVAELDPPALGLEAEVPPGDVDRDLAGERPVHPQ